MTPSDNNTVSSSEPRIERKELYAQLESHLDCKVLSFVTSERRGMETQIAQDCIDPFVDLLDAIGPTNRLALILHTLGGNTLAAWRLINLIRMFCEELYVLIPSKALSAGTLISIGADKVIMTKQAALGPIDPSVSDPLNPQAVVNGQPTPVPVSVESVRGYLDAAREELQITDSEHLASILVNLSTHIHPLVLGSIFRTQSQIRFLARKLLSQQIENESTVESIIKFLCADSGSHDYTINRREALELGLKVDKPSDELYAVLRQLHLSFMNELKISEPYSQHSILQGMKRNSSVAYSIPRGFIESMDDIGYSFVSEGKLTLVAIPGDPPQEGVKDDRHFEGWRRLG
ncbi:MAG: serine protease [Gammaproteobacteria bacterium]|nr:serine protease [Gammaproteobacteria bacterium]